MKAIDKDKNYSKICLDFSKAFDRVPHPCLMFKEQTHGADWTVMVWIKSRVYES